MAFVHGKDSYVSIDGNNVTTYLDQASLQKIIDLAETSTFGSSDKTFIAGLRDTTLDINGVWDATSDGYAAGWDDLGSVTCIVGPAGNTSGKVRYTFSAFLSNYSQQMTVSDKVTWSANLQRTGATTRDTF